MSNHHIDIPHAGATVRIHFRYIKARPGDRIDPAEPASVEFERAERISPALLPASTTAYLLRSWCADWLEQHEGEALARVAEDRSEAAEARGEMRRDVA